MVKILVSISGVPTESSQFIVHVRAENVREIYELCVFCSVYGAVHVVIIVCRLRYYCQFSVNSSR